MLKLEAIKAFATIAETGSITGAARQLAVSKSVVSERLADLERGLGTKLVRRTTRRLQLTEEGSMFHARAKLILGTAEQAIAELAERRGKLVGPLRISGPVSFGSLHLAPTLFDFLAEHPGIELTLDLDDRFVDPLADGYDAVVRHGPVDDKRVIVKELARCRRVLVASPEYLQAHGTPASIADLSQHRGIIYTNRGAADWRFHVGSKLATARPRTAFHVNNCIVMRDAAVAGLGIALLPTFMLEDQQLKHALTTLDVGAEAESGTIYIAYAEHLRSSAKMRALTTWLQQSLGDQAYWNSARTPRAAGSRQ